jgi:hypothetical protein
VLDALPQPEAWDVAVHVRRTDYLTMGDYLPVLPVRYYAAASEALFGPYGSVDVTGVHVFSDDPDWCREHLPWEVRSVGTPPADEPMDWADMLLMARYSALVIANSSYSWWSAWLSGSVKVVAPRPWFGKMIPMSSPALPEWIEVEA